MYFFQLFSKATSGLPIPPLLSHSIILLFHHSIHSSPSFHTPCFTDSHTKSITRYWLESVTWHSGTFQIVATSTLSTSFMVSRIPNLSRYFISHFSLYIIDLVPRGLLRGRSLFTEELVPKRNWLDKRSFLT